MKSFTYLLIDIVKYGFKGDARYKAWLGFLSFFLIFWAYGNYQQQTQGMIVTGLTDQVSWGVYLANFIFLVGFAAAAVTVVFPAYVYKHEAMLKVAVLGEMMAIAAVLMCLLFVLNHMGRVDRLWHMIPYLGIYNWPHSMLTWDVLVLVGYLILNIICGFYYLHQKYTDRPINKSWYVPLVFVAIIWAFSIHTVTAFLINTMPARPMWNHGMMPIKFISTAFAAGPCVIISVFLLIRKHTRFVIEDSALNLLSLIVTVCLGIALFLTFSEMVTEFYHPTEHSFGLRYLVYGYQGLNKLVPYFWVSIIILVVSFGMLLVPSIRHNLSILPYLCVAVFVGIWLEKGMELLLPGFSPSPIGEMTEYYPSFIEIANSLGNWALGFIVLSVLVKGAVGVLVGDIKYKENHAGQRD
ncbi:MAG: polysulfide reductase NrfD [Gammaproteobacteria bacterium]|nr:polysulfide reductase NrfD [Gammaproteobacteria bacterium]